MRTVRRCLPENGGDGGVTVHGPCRASHQLGFWVRSLLLPASFHAWLSTPHHPRSGFQVSHQLC